MLLMYWWKTFIPCQTIAGLLGGSLNKGSMCDRFCSIGIVWCPWDLYICVYGLFPQNASVFLQPCIAFVKDVVEIVCQVGKDRKWVPRAGTCIPLSLGSKISKSKIGLTVSANLNCEVEDMIWLQSFSWHASILHKNCNL